MCGCGGYVDGPDHDDYGCAGNDGCADDTSTGDNDYRSTDDDSTRDDHDGAGNDCSPNDGSGDYSGFDDHDAASGSDARGTHGTGDGVDEGHRRAGPGSAGVRGIHVHVCNDWSSMTARGSR